MNNIINRLWNAQHTFRTLVKNPDSQTYYPNVERKSKRRIIIENLLWLLTHGEVNHFYYLYGFDRKNFYRPQDYFGEQEFCRIRDKANAYRQIGDHKARYICMLQDKFIFGQYLTALGFPTSPIQALCDSQGIAWTGNPKKEPWDQLSSHGPLDSFLKDSLGRCGKAVFPLRIADGKIYLADHEITHRQLQQKIDGKYIIQQRIYQHPGVSRMYPHSINTIRFITLRKGDQIILASGTFRMGAGGNRFDNWAGGGIGVGIDVKSGKLNEEGTFRLGFGGRVKAHPETGVQFASYEIPYYQQAAKLVQELHSFFYGVHSIGWDIAITEKGPVVIEGNNSWDIAFQQFHDNTIKLTFLDSLKV